MNKKQLSDTWSAIIRLVRVNLELTQYYKEFVFMVLSKTKSYNYIKAESGYKLTCRYYQISSGRRVKMIHAYIGDRYIPLPKTKIIEQVLPKKTRNNSKDDHYNLFISAARNIIDPQIKEYRECVEFPLLCPLTSNKLTNWSQVHIDHSYPFINLLTDWLKDNEITYKDVKLKGTRNNKTFKDSKLTTSWYNYHFDNSNLQAISKDANLSKGSKIL